MHILVRCVSSSWAVINYTFYLDTVVKDMFQEISIEETVV